MPEIILSAALAIILTAVATRWIDSLYALPDAPLAFPEIISIRAKFRKPMLAVILFAGFSSVSGAPLPLAIYLGAAIFFLAVVTATDFEQMVIFNRVLAPFALVGILAAVHLGLPLAGRFLAAVLGGGIFWLVALVTRGGIGGGDVKLVAALGIWLGVKALLNVVLAASIAGGIVALILLIAKKITRDSQLAYGPYFALAAVIFLAAAKNLG